MLTKGYNNRAYRSEQGHMPLIPALVRLSQGEGGHSFRTSLGYISSFRATYQNLDSKKKYCVRGENAPEFGKQTSPNYAAKSNEAMKEMNQG